MTVRTVPVAIETLAEAAGKGAPEDIEVDPLTEAKATDAYLNGEGADLVELLDLLKPLAAEAKPAAPTCEAAASGLRELGTPDELLALTRKVPDRPTAEIAENLATAGGRSLQACGSDVSAQASAELAHTWVLWFLRVQEVGA